MSPVLGRALAAPSPGWTIDADAIVVGSGVAGLTAALELRDRVQRVLLVTKTVLASGSTLWAQGGVAAALDPTDSPDAHWADTLVAGGGICDPVATEVLVTRGPDQVRRLIERGASFDRDGSGQVLLGLEGGHHASRIAHAGGDATGAEISRALVAQIEAVRHDPGIEVIEDAIVLDLLQTGEGTVCGVTLHVLGAGSRDGVGAARARAVVLATGGIGQVYPSSTNPAQATGDGLAAALRAGAELADVEFVQFHPTVLWLGGGTKGQLTLISEAVRGEGARLLDTDGTRFMPRVHPMAELAPRDVVSHAIVERIAATGADHVLLDARHLGAEFVRDRFPTITSRLASAGFDLGMDLVPVAPAQHYHSGGVRTDVRGRTTLHGLYAIGEVACTGVHGANRLASNSLLEGLVFAQQAAVDIAAQIDAGRLPLGEPVDLPRERVLVSGAARSRVQRIAAQGPGVVRDAPGLRESLSAFAQVRADAHVSADLEALPQAAEWETTNVHQVATVLAAAALAREESRGGHSRSDFPQRSAAWRRRTVVHLDDAGGVVVEHGELLSEADRALRSERGSGPA